MNNAHGLKDHGDKPELQALAREISVARNLVIQARCKDDLPSPEQIAARLQDWAGNDDL